MTIRIVLFLAAFLALPCVCWAQRIDQLPEAAAVSGGMEERIAAVVNDNVISTSDINARIKLALLSSGLPDNEEVRQRLLPQILRSLIDEQLQVQEAKRLDISISKEEVEQALMRIAQDNNIQTDMQTYLAERGGSPEALKDQVRATLSWTRVVQRELRPRVDVGDDEIDAAIERMRANAGKEEFLVSEIFLAVDNPRDEAQIRQFAENLVQQLKEGASFGGVARQFSQGTGAASGGDIGWIQEGQLASELNKALVNAREGDILGPLRSTSGYHILGIRQKRTISLSGNSDPTDVTLSLQQVFRPANAGGDAASEAEQLRGAVTSCGNLRNTIAEKFPSWRWNDLGEIKLNKIPNWMGEKVRDVSEGKGTETIATGKGSLIIFVCKRNVPDNGIDRNAIINVIGTEKLELQARRLLRDLRRNAYIDVRLAPPAS